MLRAQSSQATSGRQRQDSRHGSVASDRPGSCDRDVDLVTFDNYGADVVPNSGASPGASRGETAFTFEANHAPSDRLRAWKRWSNRQFAYPVARWCADGARWPRGQSEGPTTTSRRRDAGGGRVGCFAAGVRVGTETIRIPQQSDLDSVPDRGDGLGSTGCLQSSRAKIKLLVNEEQPPNNYQVGWNGTDDYGREAGSGVYFYELQTSKRSTTGRMVLVK